MWVMRRGARRHSCGMHNPWHRQGTEPSDQKLTFALGGTDRGALECMPLRPQHPIPELGMPLSALTKEHRLSHQPLPEP